MIDVVFLLLIFFMVTTTFEREAVLKIQLPQARGQKQDPKRALEIVVDAEGRYYLNQHELADQRVETLKRALAKALEEGASPMVVIAADRKTPHQAVIRVLDAARQLHLHRVAFATRISTEE
jgi:biopolymer transport protein ExbD